MDVTALAQDWSGGAPGSQEFMGALQKATTSLWNEVSPEEKERYAEMAKDWTRNGPPRFIQAKSVTSAHTLKIPTNLVSQNGFSCHLWANSLGLPNAVVQDMRSPVDCIARI